MRVFISYRRDDLDGHAGIFVGRLRDRLADSYGADNVFMDVDSVPAGEDFVKYIRERVGQAQVFLAIIGPQWHQHIAERADSESDFVRIEVESALSQDLRVIPILVGETKMPQSTELPESIASLARRNARDVSTGRDFNYHVSRLVDELDRLNSPEAAKPPKKEKKKRAPRQKRETKREKQERTKKEGKPKRVNYNWKDAIIMFLGQKVGFFLFSLLSMATYKALGYRGEGANWLVDSLIFTFNGIISFGGVLLLIGILRNLHRSILVGICIACCVVAPLVSLLAWWPAEELKTGGETRLGVITILVFGIFGPHVGAILGARRAKKLDSTQQPH